VRIDQYGGDLAAYRDDAHLAAWLPHNIEGHAWEAFSYLWSGEANTLDELFYKLECRGCLMDEYQQALAELLQRGWIKEDSGSYQLTIHGQEIRRAAEEATDQYFYAPWSCLSPGETDELRTLSILLRDVLRING
jgi:hypothetical protein